MKGDLDSAISDYDKAIQINPDFAAAYVNCGYAYYTKGEFDRAISDFDQAIQLIPDEAQVYFDRGLVYVDKGDIQNATADFKKVLELCGNSTLCQEAEHELEKLGAE